MQRRPRLPLFLGACFALCPFADATGSDSWAGEPQARGLDVRPRYMQRGSTPPAWDPEVGPDNEPAHLKRIFEAAAAVWEDVYRLIPAETIEVRYRWHAPDGSLLAVTTRPPLTDWRIDFDPDAPWYADPDPTEHSEFDMQQLLYVDATPDPDWFSPLSAPPQWFEISYAGEIRPSATGPTSGDYDLFTVALHEIGHAIGLHGTGDRFHVPIELFTGNLCSPIVTLLTDDDPGSCVGQHLAVPSLMACSLSSGRRVLPAVPDIVAIALSNAWTDYTLPRREQLASCDGSYSNDVLWNNGEVWFGGRPPDARTDASIRQYASRAVRVVGLAQACRLLLAEGRLLSINSVPSSVLDRLVLGESLTVLGDDTVVSIEATASLVTPSAEIDDATAVVAADGLFEVSDELSLSGSTGLLALHGTETHDALLSMQDEGVLDVLSHAEVSVQFGKVRAGRVTTYEPSPSSSSPSGFSRITGHGTVEIARTLDNGGLLAAEHSNGHDPLEFRNVSGNVVPFDLDGVASSYGPEIGELHALEGSLKFRDGNLADPFDGLARIVREITFHGMSFALGSGGTVRFEAGAGDHASLAAAGLEIAGSIQVQPDTEAWGASDSIELLPTGSLTVEGRLDLVGDLIIHDRSGARGLAGPGTLVQAGDLDVHGVVFLDVAEYDWDGSLHVGGLPSGRRTRIHPGGRFLVTGDLLGTFDGEAMIEPFGSIDIHDSLELGVDGRLVLEGTELTYAPILRVSNLVNFGTITGTDAFDEPSSVSVIGGLALDLGIGRLDATHVINHGTIRVTSGSILVVNGTIENFGTIDATAGVVMYTGDLIDAGTVLGTVVHLAL